MAASQKGKKLTMLDKLKAKKERIKVADRERAKKRRERTRAKKRGDYEPHASTKTSKRPMAKEHDAMQVASQDLLIEGIHEPLDVKRKILRDNKSLTNELTKTTSESRLLFVSSKVSFHQEAKHLLSMNSTSSDPTWVLVFILGTRTISLTPSTKEAKIDQLKRNLTPIVSLRALLLLPLILLAFDRRARLRRHLTPLPFSLILIPSLNYNFVPSSSLVSLSIYRMRHQS